MQTFETCHNSQVNSKLVSSIQVYETCHKSIRNLSQLTSLFETCYICTSLQNLIEILPEMNSRYGTGEENINDAAVFPDYKSLQQRPEKLASLVIMGAQMNAPLNPSIP